MTPNPSNGQRRPLNKSPMSLFRFGEHFLAAYGALWFGLLVLALHARTYIDTGMFGLVGFPFLAFCYALMRFAFSTGANSEVDRLHQYIRFLEASRETTSRTL